MNEMDGITNMLSTTLYHSDDEQYLIDEIARSRTLGLNWSADKLESDLAASREWWASHARNKAWWRRIKNFLCYRVDNLHYYLFHQDSEDN